MFRPDKDHETSPSLFSSSTSTLVAGERRMAAETLAVYARQTVLSQNGLFIHRF
jgi:hypothetical protein